MGVRESRNPRASPGGTPEPFDADRDATLAREAFEENQVRISATTAYLGYQEVRQPGRPVIAQLRMAGNITEFAARAPDPDNGRLNRRYMTSLAAVHSVLGCGQPAEAQARAAAAAGRRWGLRVDHPAAAWLASDSSTRPNPDCSNSAAPRHTAPTGRRS